MVAADDRSAPERAASGGPGIIVRDAHFPGRAPIESYGNGGFRFAGMSHRGSILVLPSGIHGWDPAVAAEFTAAAFAPIFAEGSGIDILLIGTGLDLVPIEAALKQRFRDHAIQADAMSTGAAVRTLNVLLAENRAVAAALLAVE